MKALCSPLGSQLFVGAAEFPTSRSLPPVQNCHQGVARIDQMKLLVKLLIESEDEIRSSSINSHMHRHE